MSNIDNNPGALLAKIAKLEKEAKEAHPHLRNFYIAFLVVILLMILHTATTELNSRPLVINLPSERYFDVSDSTPPKGVPLMIVREGYQDSAGTWHDYETGRTVSPPKYWRLP